MNFSATVQKKTCLVGNKCGHDRSNPKGYLRPKTQRRRYHVLEELQRRILEARDINPYKYGLASLLFHNKNNKSRRIRSELKEAVFFCLQKVIDYTDLYSLQFGLWDNKNQFQFYNGYSTIAKESPISLRRVGKAMRFLQSKGIVTVFTIKKINQKGEYRTEKTIITLDPKIFELAALTEEYNQDFVRSAKNYEKRAAKIRIEHDVISRETDSYKFQNRSVKIKHKKNINFAVAGSDKLLKSNLSNTESRSYNPRQDRRIMMIAKSLQSKLLPTHSISVYKEIITFLENADLLKNLSHSNVLSHIQNFYKRKFKIPLT